LIDGKRLSVMVDNASNDYHIDVNEIYTAINRSSSDTGAVLETSVLFLMQRIPHQMTIGIGLFGDDSQCQWML
jgi:hypothetical protein